MTGHRENIPVGSFRAAYYQFNDKPLDQAPTRRDFYKVWLILHEGFLTLDEATVYIQQPAVLFLHPLVKYAFEPVVLERRGYWCIFTAEFLEDPSRERSRLGNGLFPTSGLVLFPPETALATIRFYFDQLVSEGSSGYAGRYDSCRNLLQLLLHEGRKLEPVTTRGQHQNASTRLATRFLNLLERQYPLTSPLEPVKLRKPADFANELAVHVNHLNAVVRQITGRSTRQIISERLLSESKALLYYSDWSVADIAYSLGFEYPNHFTTFFRRNTGQTPLSLRK